MGSVYFYGVFGFSHSSLRTAYLSFVHGAGLSIGSCSSLASADGVLVFVDGVLVPCDPRGRHAHSSIVEHPKIREECELSPRPPGYKGEDCVDEMCSSFALLHAFPLHSSLQADGMPDVLISSSCLRSRRIVYSPYDTLLRSVRRTEALLQALLDAWKAAPNKERSVGGTEWCVDLTFFTNKGISTAASARLRDSRRLATPPYPPTLTATAYRSPGPPNGSGIHQYSALRARCECYSIHILIPHIQHLPSPPNVSLPEGVFELDPSGEVRRRWDAIKFGVHNVVGAAFYLARGED
ncbi:hypothetical protein MSAN_01309800 [Mycena sanguinolenta]|uniref:Uncharacterized protein n=1 Tax=Mycena sanguinolenta TaxID=230812 RepID=A0A8H6YDH5_9AGAR|nr:hypothetical protein MSAN_01309800 [Mycena sanguinolenta]